VLVRFGGILFLVALAVWLYCLLDAITADKDEVRGLPKGVWIVIVVLTFEVGSIAWLVWGRPRERGTSPRAGGRPRLGSSGRTAWPARPGGRPRSGSSGSSGPLAPDDDPEFLARLDRQAAEEHEKLLGSWEEDLRRREDELRQRGPDDPDDREPPASA
jgi:Phospholipase_D-nuclease N-terminal